MDDLTRIQAELIALQTITAHIFGTLARQQPEPSAWLHEEEARLQARLDKIITATRPDAEDLSWAETCQDFLERTMTLVRYVAEDQR